MKNLISKLRTPAIATFVALSLFVTTASATNETKNIPGVELQMVGRIANQPVFQIDFNNTESDEFLLTITDDNGVELYTERLTGKNLSKKFRLNTEELGSTPVNVQIRSRKSNKIETFRINRNTRLVEENLISKL